MSRRGEARADSRGRPPRGAACASPVVRWIDNGAFFNTGKMSLELRSEDMDAELREELEKIREVIEEHGCKVEEIPPI